MEWYEIFNSLKQKGMTLEYKIDINNLSIHVGLSETNEQMTSQYLASLNQSIRDEMGVVCLFNLEDADNML